MTTATHTFYATGLLSKWGFGDGSTPDAVMDGWFDRADAQRAAAGTPRNAPYPDFDWENDVLIPVVRHLLVPAIDADLEVYTIGSHNPIRVETVNGEPVDTRSIDIPAHIETLFTDVTLTVPVNLLVRALFHEPVLAGLDRLSGLDLNLVGAALCAGLTVDEIADTAATGLDGLRVLVSLRHN